MRRLFFFSLAVFVLSTAAWAQPTPDEKLAAFDPFETLYILRVAENGVMADVRLILADPENEKDGYLWAMKVLAFDFALLSKLAAPHHTEVSKIYEERSEIYARYVRGESDDVKLKAEEKANEDRKNANYNKRFEAYSDTDKAAAQLRKVALDNAAREVGNAVIGQAKIFASERPK
ncbi:hypothetical protein [Mesorhizobium sp. M1322]|uniref:hypothetical protein n=1 Tax=Mesorhizobium sp. M1322 TaxID=2957081 RepID=UPI003334DE04